MKTFKIIFSLLLAVATAGCSTVPFTESKPLQYEQGFFQEGFSQGGEFVDREQAEAALRTVPAAADHLQKGKNWNLAATLTDIGGVVVALSTPWDRYGTSGQYWIGLGMIIAAIPMFVESRSQYSLAADAYNGQLLESTKKPAPLQTYLSPVKDGAVVGLNYTF